MHVHLTGLGCVVGFKMSKRLRQKDDELCLLETVNMQQLKYIMENMEVVMVREERTKFQKYATIMTSGDGSRFVTYQQSKKHGKGRLQAAGSLSLQGFSR